MPQIHTSQNYREIRKIQLTGKSTFILSLPKKWIKEMHLAPGDQVALVREPDTNSVSMIVDSGKAKTTALTGTATVFVFPKDGPETLKRKIIAMYLAGYTIINLRAKSGRISAGLREAVRELVRKNLIGTEIIADSSDEVTLQVLLALPELSVVAALKRMYLIASSMHRDALASLAEKNSGRSIAEGVIKTDDEVDRFSLYISRNLALALRSRQILEEFALQDSSNCLSYRIAVKSIERIGDHAVGIAEKSLVVKTVSGALMEKLSKMSEHSLSVLEDSVSALLKRDYELADSTVDRADEIYGLENEVIALVENKEGVDFSASIRLVVEDIRRTAEYASDVAEAAINETIGEIISKEEPLLPQQHEDKEVKEKEEENEGQNRKLVKGASRRYHV